MTTTVPDPTRDAPGERKALNRVLAVGLGTIAGDLVLRRGLP